MTKPAHTPTLGPITYFVGNADGRGLIRIEADSSSPDAGEHIASMPRGKKSEANAAQLVKAWNTYIAQAEIQEQARATLDAYDQAMACQGKHAHDAKLIVMANYGDLCAGLLRAALKAAGVK